MSSSSASRTRVTRHQEEEATVGGPWGTTSDGGCGDRPAAVSAGVVGAPRRVLRAQATAGVGVATVRRLESRDRGVRRGRVRSFGLDGPLLLLLGFTRI